MPNTFQRRVWPGERVPTAAGAAAASARVGWFTPFTPPLSVLLPMGANTEVGGEGVGWAGQNTVESKQYSISLSQPNLSAVKQFSLSLLPNSCQI